LPGSMMPRTWFWLIFGATAYYAVFRLPFHFPLTHRVVSASYCFGFNNRAAVLAMIVLIAVAFVYRLIERKSSLPIFFLDRETTRVSYRLVAGAALIYLIATLAVLIWARSESWYGMDWEASHFLWRLKLTEIYGPTPGGSPSAQCWRSTQLCLYLDSRW
jgi:hypothetical protein